MGYAFRRSDNVASQVRDIAAEQVEKCLRAIREGGDFDETVHTLRKACKKLKALLRLVRREFPAYQLELAAVRAIADGLSEARDAAVMVATFDDLLSAEGGRLDEDVRSAAGAQREKLAARAVHLSRQMGREALIQASAEQLEALGKRVEDWQFDEKGIDILLPGLKASFARVRKRLKLAESDGLPTTVHDLRKAVKVHWYHMRLFQSVAPTILDPQVAALEKLGNLLGDHNNLAVLDDWLATATTGDEKTARALSILISERQQALRDQALPLIALFAAERPASLARRFHAYWKLWPEAA